MWINSRTKQRGSALLAVLWLSAALAAIALSVSSTVRSETDRATTNSEGLRAWYLATGAVERGIQWMMWGPDYRNGDGSPRFWEPNRARMAMSFPSGEAVVEMIPEMSKLNVNTASQEDLIRVITLITGDPLRAAAIVEGIRSGATGSGPNFGFAPTFQTRRASIQEIEELLTVPGVTPELFYGSFAADARGREYPHSGLRDCLSVWGSSGPFDVNTASPELLEAVGIPHEGVVRLLERRAAAPIAQRDLGSLDVPRGRIMVGGNVIWTLRATARLRHPDGTPSDVVRSAAAVVKLVDRRLYFANPVHVLRYYEDAWSPYLLAPPARPAPGPVLGASR